jgi:hypothetical protein
MNVIAAPSAFFEVVAECQSLRYCTVLRKLLESYTATAAYVQNVLTAEVHFRVDAFEHLACDPRMTFIRWFAIDVFNDSLLDKRVESGVPKKRSALLFAGFAPPKVL